MRVFLLSISLLISIAATAWASCTSASKDSSCHFEWDASKRFPQEAKRLGRGAAVYICNGKNARVLLASPIKRHPTGVCSFWWQNMDAKEGTSQEDMRQQVMQISSGACPRQSDPSYIDSTKVSEEMFGEIMRKWDAAGSSDKGRFAFPPQ